MTKNTKENKTTELARIKSDVGIALSDKENAQILLQSTFKGLDQNLMRQAMIEGMVRGFTLKDFLEKNIYAVPFKSSYSLLTSIDHARKIGMRSGIVGKSAPTFEQDGPKKIVSCTVTVQKKVSDYVGDFTATVYFDEYYRPGKNGKLSLWDTKPRTMIAKVAEMHALRMACPEELSQSYVEEEMEREFVKTVELDLDDYQGKLTQVKDMEELKRVWSALPIEAKKELGDEKNEMKKKFEPIDVEAKEKKEDEKL